MILWVIPGFGPFEASVSGTLERIQETVKRRIVANDGKL